jgi:hypothetical protein
MPQRRQRALPSGVIAWRSWRDRVGSGTRGQAAEREVTPPHAGHTPQAGDPHRQSNGLALCVLHHKTFDLGAFTVGADGLLLVSDQSNDTAGFHEALFRHHGVRVRPPQRPEWGPDPAFLDWHRRQVFKGAARHLGPEAGPRTG